MNAPQPHNSRLVVIGNARYPHRRAAFMATLRKNGGFLNDLPLEYREGKAHMDRVAPRCFGEIHQLPHWWAASCDHIEAIEAALAGKADHLIVLEDDAHFTDGFEEDFLSAWNALPEGWRALRLGWNRTPETGMIATVWSRAGLEFAYDQLWQDRGTVIDRAFAKIRVRHPHGWHATGKAIVVNSPGAKQNGCDLPPQDNPVTFITTAKGEKHRRLAAALAASFAKWGWPKLYIVADAEVEGFETIVATDAHEKGRGLKTQFASFIPEVEGNVYFIDCDCEALAPPTWITRLSEGQVAGLPRASFKTDPISHLVCSGLLGFASWREAVDLGKEWWRQYQLTSTPSDEPALYRALFRTSKRWSLIPCGTRTEPLPGLTHHLVTTGRVKIPRHRLRDFRHWFDFRDVYDLAVARAPDGATLVEIGVWQGQSLDYLAKRAATTGKKLRVIGYDQFDPNYYLGAPEKDLTAVEWLSKVSERCKGASVVRSDSVAAAENHDDGSVYFVFLDGGHTEPQLTADIQAWLPKIALGGSVGGHDLDNPLHPSVRATLEKSGLRWESISKSSWIITDFSSVAP